jgi:acetyl esterase/lipase
MGRIFNLVASEPGLAIRRGLRYGPLPRQLLDVYEADPRKAQPTIVVFLYGGGWRDGARETYRFVGAALAAQGVTTVVPDYRLFPAARFPDFMEDAARAYRWIDAHLNRETAWRKPVLLMGHSAGAHMAALLALDASHLKRFAPEAPAPAGLIGLAGPYAFDPTTWDSTREIFTQAAPNPDMARPVAHVGAGAPNTLLLYGLADAVVARFNAQELAAALSGAGGKVQLIEYPGIGHAGLITAMGRGLRWRAPALRDVLRFIGERSAPSAAVEEVGRDAMAILAHD